MLVTHHVDLVLPGAHYLVRMLDGRIDTQGAVADLRAQGVLESIEHSAMIDAHKEKLSLVEMGVAEGSLDDTPKPDDVIKKPRKLVKDEHRETGGVKWSVYKTYLKASYVISKIPGCLLMPSQILLDLDNLGSPHCRFSAPGNRRETLDNGLTEAIPATVMLTAFIRFGVVPITQNLSLFSPLSDRLLVQNICMATLHTIHTCTPP